MFSETPPEFGENIFCSGIHICSGALESPPEIFALHCQERSVSSFSSFFVLFPERLRCSWVVWIAVFSNKYPGNKQKIKFGNSYVGWSESIKYLGVHMDYRLNFPDHVKEITNRAETVKSQLYPLLNKKSPLPLNIKLSLQIIHNNIQCMVNSGFGFARFGCGCFDPYGRGLGR